MIFTRRHFKIMGESIGLDRVPWMHHQGFSRESHERGLQFHAKPTDVIVCTVPKSGTTLLQWMCHLIRNGGKLGDFQDLYQVSPWIPLAWDMGLDANTTGSEFFPRVFKAHVRLASITPGCKYIATVRDPERVAISWFNFLYQKQVPPVMECGSVSNLIVNEDFFAQGMRFGASIWEYFLEYYKCYKHPNVLVLVFEDLIKEKEKHVRLIADFMGVGPLSHQVMEMVVDGSSKETMAKHESRIDESWTYERIKELGRSPDIEGWKPATRVVMEPHQDEISDDAKRFLEQKWKQTIAKETGCETYQAFADLFRSEINNRLANIDTKQHLLYA